MRSHTLLTAFVAALLLVPGAAQAQKQKKLSLPPGDLFFTMKGRPFALERVVPGIQGALLLSDEQKQELLKALEETTWSEEVRSAGRTIKADPNATEAQKEQARTVIQQARARLELQVDGVLTHEQKQLVDRLNSVAREAHLAAREQLEAEFTAAKGDKARTQELNNQMRVQARGECERRLIGLLTAEQQRGFEKAAQQQKAAEEAAAKKKK